MKTFKKDCPYRSRHAERGAISTVCLVLTLLAVLVTLSISSESINELHRSRGISDSATALSIAEAGADYTIAQIRQSSGYTGTGGPVTFDRGTFSTTVTISGGNTVIDSTGTLKNGVTKTVEVVMSGSGGGSMFPDGAMISNGSITLNGQAYTTTSPSTQHIANVRANGNVTCSGQTTVDGGIYAGGSLSLSGQPTYVVAKSGVTAMSFPNAAAISAMQQNWITQAKKGPTIGSLTVSGQKTQTLSTPLYINGDVNINGQSKLILTGPGPVYINGKLTVSGQSELDNPGTLAVSGTIDTSGQGVYKVTGGLDTSSLLSFSSDPTQAIKISGQASNIQTGIVYAVNGGIQINGQGVVYGAVIAGSTSSNSITSSGQSSVVYPAGLNTNNTTFPKASKITSWLER